MEKKTTAQDSQSSVTYDLGRKKVAPNIGEMMSEEIWKDHLLNKWIYMYDKDHGVNTFMKHVFDGRKLLQVVVSDKKMFCDGVYRIYKVKIVRYKDNDMFVDPQDFSVVYNSVSLPPGIRYIDKLLEDGYITDAEHTVFLKRDTIEKFTQGLVKARTP